MSSTTGPGRDPKYFTQYKNFAFGRSAKRRADPPRQRFSRRLADRMLTGMALEDVTAANLAYLQQA